MKLHHSIGNNALHAGRSVISGDEKLIRVLLTLFLHNDKILCSSAKNGVNFVPGLFQSSDNWEKGGYTNATTDH
ncbi:hypothetical protein SDC9_190998 [bioreactor metagenome]|uniref:Uncharacterized protein n=1 Tax=bioreactor metagenome TaxID=1076179 RepID=A0A645HWN9_9ZZZZ